MRLLTLLLIPALLQAKPTPQEEAPALTSFRQQAGKTHGDPGKRAADFLIAGMPPADRANLTADFLSENLDLALAARKEFPWAKVLPEELFFNDVLPYACLDETRDPWRKEFLELCRPIVKEAKTTGEAAQLINQKLFNIINVHYNTGRKAPNQSPKESRELGMATCTGLSIILVDACRSVGVPARIAGTALWTNKRGNHTWVEIYHNGQWQYTGADEYDAKGLNRGWFTADASKAKADNWKYAIWATSWKKTGTHFPVVWDLNNKHIASVNVTERYTAAAKETPNNQSNVFVRLLDQAGGNRLVANITLGDKKITTRAGRADRNDMPELSFDGDGPWTLKAIQGDKTRTLNVTKDQLKSGTLELLWDAGKELTAIDQIKSWLALLPEERHLSIPDLTLDKATTIEAEKLITAAWKKDLAAARAEEKKWQKTSKDGSISLGKITAAGKTMPYLVKVFGDPKKAPAGGRSLWISMHGGGGAPAHVNDGQWKNQIQLYKPAEGIYIAPRAPTNTWNLWHEGHIDTLFDRLITSMIIHHDVNPNKVYLLGYSAGGDGVYQLAPRMADRYAAASMMAGHPNDASPLGLRNLPFMIFMGGKDAAYKRNKIAAQWGEKLATLRKDDPKGYLHKVTIYPQHGHWMNGDDAVSIPWMAKHTRNPWPKQIVWHQSSRTHHRFYWLSIPKDTAKKNQKITAGIEGQTIKIKTDRNGEKEKITLRLSDHLLDLDQPVIIEIDGQKDKTIVLPNRTLKSLWKSLQQRGDPASLSSATIEVTP